MMTANGAERKRNRNANLQRAQGRHQQPTADSEKKAPPRRDGLRRQSDGATDQRLQVGHDGPVVSDELGHTAQTNTHFVVRVGQP